MTQSKIRGLALMLLSIILALDANFVDNMFSDISGIGWICMFASLIVGVYGFVLLFFETKSDK